MGRIAHRFRRVEPCRHTRELALGLLAGLPRKNCWTLAEHAGHTSPDQLQHLLVRAKWDADEVRDDLRGFVVDHLGTDDVVLVVDETGDLKKGSHTVGVQHQYTGTAGRIENSQVAVYLAYSTSLGHASIARELYVPRSWTDDPGRFRATGIPTDHAFATKPQLALRMIERARTAGIRPGWVAGHEVYGSNTTLRDTPEQQGQAYVLAIAIDHRITTRGGRIRTDRLVRKIPNRAWQKLSAGKSAKGHRHYDWALAMIDDDRPGHRHFLVRRNRRTGELAYYRCYSATKKPLTTGPCPPDVGHTRHWILRIWERTSRGHEELPAAVQGGRGRAVRIAARCDDQIGRRRSGDRSGDPAELGEGGRRPPSARTADAGTGPAADSAGGGERGSAQEGPRA
ncbi:hypothetical protein SUDANB6_05951 [Streptomyces sp. enrichment culture]